MPQWRVADTQQRYNGTGNVILDLYAVDDEGTPIPGRHVTVSVPSPDLMVVLSLPTQPEIEAAFWNLVGVHVPSGWDSANLNAVITANTQSSDATDALTTHVNDNMGGFPIDFAIPPAAEPEVV